MPTDHVIATLRQTLLHKLAVQAAATHRLPSGCRSCTTRANGGSTRRNVFQIRLVATQQRPHHASRTDASCTSGGSATSINFVDSTHI